MASTSEELTSQADQLLNTIAFFKVGNGSGRALHGGAAQRLARPAAYHAPQIAHLAAKPAKTAGKGVQLDMSRGGNPKADHKDAEFEKF